MTLHGELDDMLEKHGDVELVRIVHSKYFSLMNDVFAVSRQLYQLGETRWADAVQSIAHNVEQTGCRHLEAILKREAKP